MRHVLAHFGDVQTLGVIDSAADIADGDDFEAQIVGALCRIRPNVAEALDGNGGVFGAAHHILLAESFQHTYDHAASGGFLAPLRTADVNGFTGDDSRDRIAHRHAVGVHHPGHCLTVCAHIRSR